MDLSAVTASELQWSIISPKGEAISISLPKTVRSFEDFIKVDIYTGDSDPVYWAVYRARKEFGPGWATRFCVGMLAYYDMGVATQAADHEGIKFWEYLAKIFPTAPRGGARRYLRGKGGEQTLTTMAAWSPNPDRFFDAIPRTYTGVKRHCENNFYAFGPYFQLKVVDYMDRCLGIPIKDMSGLERNLPGEPAKALADLYPEKSGAWEFLDLCRRVNALGIMAAPGFDRPAGPAEVETSLCGWKTTKFKGNWFGADIDDKRSTLKNCGDKGRLMSEWLPPAVKKDTFKLELQ